VNGSLLFGGMEFVNVCLNDEAEVNKGSELLFFDAVQNLEVK
jgi:hypothetical protein